jgi:hypothetical protein
VTLTPEDRGIVIRLRLQNADEAHADAVVLLDNLRMPDSHKRELDRRFQKYADNASALLTERQLQIAVNARR